MLDVTSTIDLIDVRSVGGGALAWIGDPLVDDERSTTAKMGTYLTNSPDDADVVITVASAEMVESTTYARADYGNASVPAKVEAVKLIVTVGDHQETFEAHNDGTVIWFAGPDTYWKNAAETAYEKVRNWVDINRAQIIAQRKSQP